MEPRGWHCLPSLYEGEWTNWWSDSAASSPNDTAIYRNALRNRRLITRLDRKGELVSRAELDAADRKLLLYCEHTFGSSRTAVPSLLGEQVFARKSKHAVDADEMASAALVCLLPSRAMGAFTASQPFAYTVLNPGRSARRSLAALPVNFWEAPFVNAGVAAFDDRGAAVPSQIEQSARGWNVWIVGSLDGASSGRWRLVPSSPEPLNASPDPNHFEISFTVCPWMQAAVLRASSLRTEAKSYFLPSRVAWDVPFISCSPERIEAKPVP